MTSTNTFRAHLSSPTTLALAICIAGCGGSSEPTSVTVGGTVTGLSTEGLVLRAGTESLALRPGDTRFVFLSPLAAGSNYSVQVDSQPTGRDQFCTVTGGVGTTGTSNTSTVSVSCRATEWMTSTLAGSGAYGSQDGAGSAASFSPPSGVTVDLEGNVYVADTSNQSIRRIGPSGAVTTLAGSGIAGAADGMGSAATFNMPWRVSAAPDGSVFVTDTYNQKIRKVSRDGTVTTLTGSGSIGSTDGSATTASFYYPFGLAAAFDGAVYVADNSNQSVRKVASDGTVTTFAGSGSVGFANGTGRAASFQSPYGAAVDRQGSVYIADTLNHCIRKISPTGVVTTLAGIGTRGSADGAADIGSFSDPQGVAVDAGGNVYVADTGNNAIRKVSPLGLVSTLSGNSALSVGSADGVGRTALFYFPFDIAVDQNGVLYVADWGNLKIRRISAQ